jgi:hypothetical protein
VQFPQVKKEEIADVSDAAHRKQFATFDEYVQELIREARRWKPEGPESSSSRVKGLTKRVPKRGGTTKFEARYCPKLASNSERKIQLIGARRPCSHELQCLCLCTCSIVLVFLS